MEVIGKINSETYICEINHDEIEQFMNLYYNKMNKLNVGDEIDLGKGHDFHSDIVSALKQTRDFLKANGKIVKAITNGIMVATSDKVES